MFYRLRAKYKSILILSLLEKSRRHQPEARTAWTGAKVAKNGLILYKIRNDSQP